MSQVTQNDDGTVTVTLKKPLQREGKTITSVTLRTECTVADLEAMDKAKGETEKTRLLIAELSVGPSGFGVSASALKALSSKDFLVLAREAGKAISGDDEEEDDEGEEGK